MKRRRVMNCLSVTGAAALSGCLNVKEIMASGNPKKLVSIHSTDSIPPKFNIDISVKLDRDTITPSHTALLKFTVTNNSSNSVQIGDGHNQVYSGVVGTNKESSEPKLLLISTEEDVLKDPRCWKPASSHSVPSLLKFETFDPNESKSIVYKILGQPDNKSTNCIPISDYRFETTYHVKHETNEQRFTWGFDISI